MQKTRLNEILDRLAGVVADMLMPKKYVPKKVKKITYKMLYEFAIKAQQKYPESAKSRVVCTFMHAEKKYRIIQIALNNNEKVIRSGDDCVGRMLFASNIDEEIISFIQDKDSAVFDILLQK